MHDAGNGSRQPRRGRRGAFTRAAFARALRYPAAVRFLALLVLAVFASAPLAGCINTDPTVFVAPTISAPAATVTSGVFGASIMGGTFHLDLHLGARASGPSTVMLGEFSILDATMKTTIVSPLNAASTTTFPVTVPQGGDVNADFTFDTGTKPLPMADGTELCTPAGVVIGATFQDSLMAGMSTLADSPVFEPTCM